MQSPWAGELYANARARGKRNPHATRIVARAWIRVILGLLAQRHPIRPNHASTNAGSLRP